MVPDQLGLAEVLEIAVAVAMGAEMALVTNPYRSGEAVPDNGQSGAVYVFRRTADHWQHWATLNGEGNGTPSNFGHKVAVSDPYILVAAPQDSVRGDPPAVYLYERVGDHLLQHGRLGCDDGQLHDGFAKAVAIHGRHIAVGVPGFDPAAANGAVIGDGGSCYLFDWH